MNHALIFASAILALAAGPAGAQRSFVTFESRLVRPLVPSPDGGRPFVVNTPDATLETFDVTAGGIDKSASVPVGIEPVAVAAHTNGEVWVVNHLCDSISIVDASSVPRVVCTLSGNGASLRCR